MAHLAEPTHLARVLVDPKRWKRFAQHADRCRRCKGTQSTHLCPDGRRLAAKMAQR